MDLPVMPPLSPMLAKLVTDIPAGMQYEAKWDGFRVIVFRDGDEVEIASRTTKSLTRYFPEVVTAARAELPRRCVLDGEIVIAHDGRLHFEELLERIHPADSRVRTLAERTPASLVAFDLLALDSAALVHEPQTARREALVEALRPARAPVYTAPATTDVELARRWFTQFEGAGLDGVVAKPLDLPYRPGDRAMFKIKHARTADCVVAGYRLHKSGPVVGSLLLGLYDDSGQLQHVGVSASFPMARRRALVEELAPLRMDDVAEHPWGEWTDEAAHAARRMPGGPSRWSGGKDLSWVPLRPERVCEVAYDHMEGSRFRHTAQFRRWRPDRTPESCGYDQLEEPVHYDLGQLLRD
ncbi:ATP-dependent DNA ligase [Streptomyces sp. 2333.5]|uniref:ATP-dependent DNA ligase n=1 Tax=unclassified Streptomyces TaxID=2593676 RepID=UPI0008982966|nr:MULTISPECIES: ATP-dependent DNA ligase [unclassified Streptomyces]PJJ06266.1 ATP-dependent DNA ligase [Streptomyces sp. 2333.5]SEE93057.1 ATP-dependent DNA ligase [Streptomyces sp. 2314.4]SEF08421.1 ATP-dependent DNA ligase [Streptomyces sp. 2112.2]